MTQVKNGILIVDDEKDVGRTLELMLENYGFDIDFFTERSVESYNTQNSKVYPLKGVRHSMKKPVGNEELLAQVYSMLVGPEYENG